VLYQWSMTSVDSVRETAKQRQVRTSLEELIATLSPGEPLPVERDLARDLGVARMTLRRAVDRLVAERRLIRRQGSGTFVAAPKVTQRLTATSFSADMRARGLRPGGHSVFARVAPAGGMRASLLGVSPHVNVLHVRRLRMADDQPMALEDLHVPSEIAPGLTGDDLENTSFYELLAQRYETPIVSGTQTVEPCLITAEEAELLGVGAGAPAFLFERTSRTADGRVAEFVRSIYRGDRYRIVVDIFPQPGPLTDPRA
jgi:GntR family transcriptional regulator